MQGLATSPGYLQVPLSGDVGSSDRITIEGELSERFASEFEGMTLESRHGKTLICGSVVDQSHLHGILARIQDLGLALVGVAEVPEGSKLGRRRQGKTKGQYE